MHSCNGLDSNRVQGTSTWSLTHLSRICEEPDKHQVRRPSRDLDTIDSELRLLTAVRWSIREHGGEPSSRQLNELLDERLAQRESAKLAASEGQ
jgi:hypothetical protein